MARTWRGWSPKRSASWDSQTIVDKLELNVGRDLQYIRLNGTIIGGLVGLVLHVGAEVL
jgi:uncharacterized membrane-anchored protein YjiN (DUF445 family)